MMEEECRLLAVQALRERKNDGDLVRARAFFKDYSLEDMDKTYGFSMMTPRQIIDGYEEENRRIDRAIAWVMQAK
jgi:hypothetical protein